MLKILRRDEEGAAAIEFAIAVPILVTMLYGIFQVGLLFQANAGMQHALGEGARYATLCLSPTSTGCTVPTDANIKAKINAKLFGKSDGTFTVSDPVTTSNSYKTLTVTYSRAMNFLFFQGPTVTLTRSKTVYIVQNT
ncbi:MAG TPA: TadE/TadG family type IV pilus assembly protein [Sphingomicrobium sp.]|nr:TadE/TadG family type IV pilus assembly protein [Sphingomicrobium sp.]